MYTWASPTEHVQHHTGMVKMNRLVDVRKVLYPLPLSACVSILPNPLRSADVFMDEPICRKTKEMRINKSGKEKSKVNTGI